MNNKNIGATISNLRKSKGYTQKALSEIIYVSPKAISKWETGDGIPEITNLMELAKVFNVSVDYILQGLGSSGVKNLETTHRRFNLLVTDNEIIENVGVENIEEKKSKTIISKNDVNDKTKTTKDKSKRTVDEILSLVDNVATKTMDVTKDTLMLSNQAHQSRMHNMSSVSGGETKSSVNSKRTTPSYYYGHWISFALNILMALLVFVNLQTMSILSVFSIFIIFLVTSIIIGLSVVTLVSKKTDNISKKFAIFNIVVAVLILLINMIIVLTYNPYYYYYY